MTEHGTDGDRWSEILYDEFVGPGLDPTRWTMLKRRLPGGGFRRCAEPEARVDVMDGFLCVTVDSFQTSHDTLQSVDNVKHMLVSTTEFAAPRGGTAVLELAQRARLVSSPPDSEQLLGAVVCNVVDLAGGNVFGFAVGGGGVRVVHESFGADPLLTPMLCASVAEEGAFVAASQPGQRHVLRLSFELAADAVAWSVDGTVVHRAEAASIPGSMQIGLGLITGVALGEEGSRSLRGQGLHACWSAPRMTVVPA